MKIVMVVVLFLAGCGPTVNWGLAAANSECTADQMNKVQAEATWCSTNTDYLSTYCYQTAILRNCTEKKQ